MFDITYDFIKKKTIYGDFYFCDGNYSQEHIVIIWSRDKNSNNSIPDIYNVALWAHWYWYSNCLWIN